MKKEDVRDAIACAVAFIDMAEDAIAYSGKGENEDGSVQRGKVAATLRRKSLALSESLTAMRKPE